MIQGPEKLPTNERVSAWNSVRVCVCHSKCVTVYASVHAQVLYNQQNNNSIATISASAHKTT